MANTGPTGTTLDDAVAAALSGASGLTGAHDILMAFAMNTPVATGPTGPTGPTEPVNIATLDELMASHAVVVVQEAADRIALACLSAPTRDGYRTQLFQWAAAGFPDLYIVHSIPITPPSICSDGVVREIGKYAEFCMCKDLGNVVASLATLMPGIQPSWSVNGNTLRIHVTKAS